MSKASKIKGIIEAKKKALALPETHRELISARKNTGFYVDHSGNIINYNSEPIITRKEDSLGQPNHLRKNTGELAY